MTSEVVAYVVAGLVTLLATGFSILVQRQLRNSDAASDKKDADNDSRFREHGSRMGEMQNHLQALELALASKVGRDELKQIFDKVDSVQRDFKDDMKDLKAEILSAIGHR